jgi:hypothetical protein
VTERAPIYVIRLTPKYGTGIHGLRAILKRLGRTHGFKCLSAREEIPAPQDSPPDGSGN